MKIWYLNLFHFRATQACIHKVWELMKTRMRKKVTYACVSIHLRGFMFSFGAKALSDFINVVFASI